MLESIPQVRDIETERKLLVSTVPKWSSAKAGHSTGLPSAAACSPIQPRNTKSSRPCALPGSFSDPSSRAAACAIGDRSIGLHLKGLELMGATIAQEHGYLEARADRLKGSHIVFDNITVTGTEDLLMAAVTAGTNASKRTSAA